MKCSYNNTPDKVIPYNEESHEYLSNRYAKFNIKAMHDEQNRPHAVVYVWEHDDHT